MFCKKGLDLGAVLLFQHRTGDIANTSAGFDERDGAIENFNLLLPTLFQSPRPHAPFGIGVATPGAGAGAGRIDQHQVHAARQVVDFPPTDFGSADLDIARTRALEPLVAIDASRLLSSSVAKI